MDIEKSRTFKNNNLDAFLKDYKLEGFENIFNQFGVTLRSAESGFYVDEYRVKNCTLKFVDYSSILESKDLILTAAIVARMFSSIFGDKKGSKIIIGKHLITWDERYIQSSVEVFNEVVALAIKETKIIVQFKNIKTFKYYQQLVFFLEEPQYDDMHNFEVECKRRS